MFIPVKIGATTSTNPNPTSGTPIVLNEVVAPSGNVTSVSVASGTLSTSLIQGRDANQAILLAVSAAVTVNIWFWNTVSNTWQQPVNDPSVTLSGAGVIPIERHGRELLFVQVSGNCDLSVSDVTAAVI